MLNRNGQHHAISLYTIICLLFCIFCLMAISAMLKVCLIGLEGNHSFSIITLTSLYRQELVLSYHDVMFKQKVH